ncbi:LOW QUALITY PROTEIN: hypothetical protein V2J09_017067, partial [Rumex salicifolius]
RVQLSLSIWIPLTNSLPINYDGIIPDEERALCFVYSLPEKYEHVIKSLIHGKDELIYNEVTTSLHSEEFRKMDRDDISREDVVML